MASTSNASAKDGERNRNMQRHVALASASVSAQYYKLYKEFVELAKRSQKLLCSPAVDLSQSGVDWYQARAQHKITTGYARATRTIDEIVAGGGKHSRGAVRAFALEANGA